MHDNENIANSSPRGQSGAFEVLDLRDDRGRDFSQADSVGAESSGVAVHGSRAMAGHTGAGVEDHQELKVADVSANPKEVNIKKIHGKPKKVVRGEQSFRPGSNAVASKPKKPKSLVYLIPTNNIKGDPREYSALQSFLNEADARLNQGKFGRFAALGLVEGCWRLSFHLNLGEGEVQDAFVSGMFQALDDLNREAGFLSDGFGTSKPASWSVAVGECVVDRGSF